MNLTVCMRDVLRKVKNKPNNSTYCISQLCEELPEWSNEALKMACQELYTKGYIEAQKSRYMSGDEYTIQKITPEGQAFLAKHSA